MSNRRRTIRIGLALILAVIGTVALMGYVRSAKDDAVSDEELVEVYVVDDLVPKGADATTIEDSVSVDRVPARLVQDGAITDLDAVGDDDVAAADLQPGDQLVAARLASRAAVLDDVTDKVQVSVKLAVERAVGGALAKGDLVGVYLSFDPFEATSVNPYDGTPGDTPDDGTGTTVPAVDKSPNYTRMEFQHVLVTNVQTTNTPVETNDESDDKVAQVTGSEYVVTLALSPEQSERFVFATEFGHVWLSKDPATVSDDGTRLVTLGNVFQVVAP